MTDNWRIFLALGLTLLVLVGWNVLFPPQQIPNQTQNTTQESTQDTGPDQAQKAQSQSKSQASPTGSSFQSEEEAAFTMAESKSIEVETPLYKAVFSSQGGVLEHFYLKKHKETIKPNSPPIDLITERALNKAPMGILWNRSPAWRKAKWSVQGEDAVLSGNESTQVRFRGVLNGIVFERTLIFEAGSYAINEDLRIENQSENMISGVLSLTMASSGLVEEESRYNKNSIAYYADQSLHKEDDTDDLRLGIESPGAVDWAGIDSSYFLMAVVPTSQNLFFKGKYEDSVYRVALEQNTNLQPGQSQEVTASYFLGPKKQDYLAMVGNDLIGALHYGWLNIIARPLVQVLKFFYSYVGNYGVAIILLTFVIKIIFWPLSHKSFKSMEKMKKIQPMMKQLKEKYKDDRQKMNQELMQLYKTYKVNPAGGCLPMLLQIPVFIGLYEALMGAVELRHASFISHFPFTDMVWLADLSAKDPFYITPVVMGLSMFLQQKLSPTAGDPTQAKIMLIMPIFLTFIFLNFPSGLVVYFFTNNMLSIFQQWSLLRKA
ncbi:MAG: membrane protein insertase YidC [Desulfovermiculus sp.]|nr:membrane protein insertase YidC [Desulfovermiculus sp.]